MTSRTFAATVAGLCVFYAVLETTYVLRLPVVMDEFQGARAVHRVADQLPYRDFKPYKTVLGYYLQLPALSLPGSIWERLLHVKLQMAGLNAVVLGAAAFVLSRRFDRRAVVAGLALLVTMSTFLERSAELRVDMPTALAGLAGLLLLLEKRIAWAGIACGISFLVSQKGIYYILATEVALIGWAVGARARDSWRNLLVFNLATAAPIAIYLGVWSLLAGPTAVFGSAVGDAGRIAIDRLEDIRLRYWGRTVGRNPAFYGLAIAALWQLDRRRRAGSADRLDRLLLLYGAALVILAALHQQPWPYFFVLLIPTLWVLIVAGFDRGLPTWVKLDPGRRLLAVVVLVVLGLLLPLSRLKANLERDNGFQRQMVELAEATLSEDDTYLAGVAMLWNREQAHTALGWLDRLQLARLEALSDADLTRLIAELRESPPKAILDNYRIHQLPHRLRLALVGLYELRWGNLLLYSPVVDPEAASFRIAYSGEYEVLSEGPSVGTLDGREIALGEIVRLEAGRHHHSGPDRIRLRLRTPELDPLLDPRYRERRALFPHVYDY